MLHALKGTSQNLPAKHQSLQLELHYKIWDQIRNEDGAAQFSSLRGEPLVQFLNGVEPNKVNAWSEYLQKNNLIWW